MWYGLDDRLDEIVGNLSPKVNNAGDAELVYIRPIRTDENSLFGMMILPAAC